MNGSIAIEPFKNTDVKTQVRSGFAVVEQKHTLAKVKVIHGNYSGTIQSGATIWVLAELFKQPWASKIYTNDNELFILMPEQFVLIVENPQ